MMEVSQSQKPQGTTTRVVYVDLDDEIDGEEEELEFGVWLPKHGEIPAFCSSHCHDVSSKALDQTEKISRTFCSQRGAEIVAQAPICNADAVDEITQKWPHTEPYALARPSESGDISGGRQRRNKERSNYAKALLCSDTELEKLSMKIRLEIQQSEMLELAMQAEHAANAGFLSFSARPSTFGVDPLQEGYLRNLRQTSTFSQQIIPTLQLRTPSEKMLKQCELRNVIEVIPQWKHLHPHVRTHLFRQKVLEAALVFNEKESSSPSPHWKANFENSASDIARQSFRFLGDFADCTVRKLRSQQGFHSRTISESTQVENATTSWSHDSESSLFGPTLASHLSSLPHGNKLLRPLLSVPHGLLHPDEVNSLETLSTTANVGSLLDLALLRGSLCKSHQDKSDRLCHGNRFAEMQIRLSSPSSAGGLQTHDSVSCIESTKWCAGVNHSIVLDTNGDNLPSSKSVPIGAPTGSRIDWDLIQHPKGQGQKEHKNLGYETPIRLRCIRGQSEWKNLADNPFFSPILGESETIDITVLTLSESFDNHSLHGKLCKSSDDEEKKDCGHSNFEEQRAIQRESESALRDCPIALPHTCQDGNDMHCNDSSDELSVHTPRDPVSFDVECHEESPSVSDCNEGCVLLSATTWERDQSESTRVLRNTHSWPQQGLAIPDFPIGTGKTYVGKWNEPESLRDAISPSEIQGVCHTFPSADENIQSAVEEMLSRLSPNTAAWRRDLFIGEKDNDEFLNNYFYNTKVPGKDKTPASSHTNDRVHVGVDSLCHVIGVDAVCSGFRFIFSEQAHRPTVMKSRQRSVSVDGRWHNNPSSSSSWYTTLEGVLSHFGSPRESSPEVDPLHFDPPHLRKASFAKY